MSANVIPRALLKAPLTNGIGRYVCQLQRLTFRFCKSNVQSFEMRNFIDQHLVTFASENPGIVVYVKPVRGALPSINAEYLNGFVDKKILLKDDPSTILRWVESFRTRSGFGVRPIFKRWSTQYSSVQGIWTPMLNLPPDAPKTSDEVLSRLKELTECLDEFPVSAQDKLLNDFEKKQHEITLE